MSDCEYQELITVYNSYLEKMAIALLHLGQDLQEAEYQEATLIIPALVDGMEWIYEALRNFIELGEIKGDFLNKFEIQIDNFNEALNNRDFTLLSDLCEYELISLMQEIRIRKR